MRSTWWTRAVRATLAAALLATTAGAGVAAAKPIRPAKRSGMNLFALTFGVMNVNNFFCGINNIGELCVDPHNSPVVGGGFWPKGTPDQYIFNSGLQLAGQVSTSPADGFAWRGDTTGAFFMDPRGDQTMGDPITLVYSSLDPSDAATWPNGGFVRDTALYAKVLVDAAAGGQVNVSQEDLWVRTWEGNPAFLSGRTHPMGILVEERGMAWNYPTGNEDIIYFVFTFYNVTADSTGNCAAYSAIDPAIRSEICAIGADFQARNEARFGINIPAAGYAFDSMYAAFFSDQDVGDAGRNYGTAVLPFNMMTAYKADFLEPTWTFPADIFGPPFVKSPGFIGMKFLRSPKGLTIWSNTLNSGTGYPDPVGVKQLFRYLSGASSPALGDFPCTFQGQQRQKQFCFAAQNFADTRGFQSSGPFTLKPGESQTIVEAYIQAAPTAVVTPFVGGDFKPGIPGTPTEIAADPSRVRPIEQAMGWVSQADTGGAVGGGPDGKIEQNEVTTVPRSLLDKALVAQAIFDNKFLLPFAPDAPTFFLVPGDNQVTIAWQRTKSETDGDPFFAVASDPTSALYDPNFRALDVEGYRIYRGRSTSTLELVAQFDYAGTSIIDYTGAFAYTADLDGDGKSECAPELGVQDDCDVDNDASNGYQKFATSPPYTAGFEHDLVGDVVQIPAGGRVLLADSSVLILKADTAVTGGRSGFPALANTGVNFAFVDRSVRNSFTYFYAVTAFDVNSLKSGPSSLESARITKSVTPRALGANATNTAFIQGVFGEDGVALDPGAAYPAMDTATGTFKSKIPPGNASAMLFTSAVIEALPLGDILVRVDSVSAGFTEGIGAHPNLYLTLSAPGNTIKKTLTLPEPAFSATGTETFTFDQPLVAYDSVRARAFGLKFTQDIRMPVTFNGGTLPISRTSGGVSVGVGRFNLFSGSQATLMLAHSRWFSGNTETTPDPTIDGFADSSHNAGALPGVSKIYAPQAYRSAVNLFLRGYSYSQTSWYPADFLVTWNADSSLTVFDSTHHITLPFSPNGGTGWGFINRRAVEAAGVTAGDLDDGTGTTDTAVVGYHHIYATQPTCYPDWWAINCALLEQKAQVGPVDLNDDGVSDGNGVALMINGEAFLMTFTAGAIPAAGTKWRLRAVTGTMDATCVPPVGAWTDCTAYSFTPPSLRPAFAPGLTYKVTVSKQFAIDSLKAGDLSRVHTVPDPYYVTNSLEATANTKLLKFVNLPNRAIVRIYSLSGVLVQVLTHNDPAGGGELTWNLRNRNNQFVASGVYFYHVEAPDGKSKVGRFTVVNFAP